MQSKQQQQKKDITCMIKNVYNYSINCWGHIDPKAQKCKQETKTI